MKINNDNLNQELLIVALFLTVLVFSFGYLKLEYIFSKSSNQLYEAKVMVIDLDKDLRIIEGEVQELREDLADFKTLDKILKELR